VEIPKKVFESTDECRLMFLATGKVRRDGSYKGLPLAAGKDATSNWEAFNYEPTSNEFTVFAERPPRTGLHVPPTVGVVHLPGKPLRKVMKECRA
jgi:hypothetical protein